MESSTHNVLVVGTTEVNVLFTGRQPLVRRKTFDIIIECWHCQTGAIGRIRRAVRDKTGASLSSIPQIIIDYPESPSRRENTPNNSRKIRRKYFKISQIFASSQEVSLSPSSGLTSQHSVLKSAEKLAALRGAEQAVESRRVESAILWQQLGNSQDVFRVLRKRLNVSNMLYWLTVEWKRGNVLFWDGVRGLGSSCE